MQSTTHPAVGTDAFAGCILLAVSVPQSAASAYNSSPSWSTVVILAPGTFSVVYNGNGSDGGIVPARQVGMTGITIQVYGNNGSLTRAGCSFNGWNTKADGTGNRFVEDGSYAGPENMTLYAQWTHPDYTVTFDDQEADIQQVSPSTMKVTAPANTIGSLPSEPRRYGYEFGGWYTEPDGAGELFVIGSSVLSSKTVYANWISLYHKVLFNSITGGTVTADKTNNILPGETVTLTINPDQGNELYSLGAKYRNTYSINISGVTYKRTFIMPSADVWITASFIPLEYTNLANLETGDIVFANGKYAKYSIFCENADIYLKCSQPIGIVAFKGGTNIFYYNETGNYQSAAAGENGKVYMLGLQESRPSFCWAPSGSTGYNKKFSTSISNGSGNWAVIQSADSYGANNASTKYPAFDYANNYSMSGFVDGWYLPAMAEVAALYRNSVYTKINNTIDSITRAGGGTFVKLPVGDTPIWSSSQVVTLNSGYESKAWCINPNATRKEYNNPKDNRFIVLVIRALN